jgi:hypothetical protein
MPASWGHGGVCGGSVLGHTTLHTRTTHPPHTLHTLNSIHPTAAAPSSGSRPARAGSPTRTATLWARCGTAWQYGRAAQACALTACLHHPELPPAPVSAEEPPYTPLPHAHTPGAHASRAARSHAVAARPHTPHALLHLQSTPPTPHTHTHTHTCACPPHACLRSSAAPVDVFRV